MLTASSVVVLKGKLCSYKRENAKKKVWIKFLIHVTSMISQSASKKTEVVYQPAPGKPYKELTIAVKGRRLQVVDKFTYLGSTLSRIVHIHDEVNARIAKASAAFGRLHARIWDQSGIRLDTKLKVYRSMVLPTLLYTCETWTVKQRDAKRLNNFHTSYLRKVARQDSRHRSPEKDGDAECAYSSETGTIKLDRLCY